MGRWLAVAREAEKKSKTPETGPDKTDETLRTGVLSVLSVPQSGKSGKFLPSTSTSGGKVSSVLSATDLAVSENSRPGKPAAGPPIHRCAVCGALACHGRGWTLQAPERARWYCSACAPTAGRA